MASVPGGPFLIGWKEYVDFPAWHIRRVKAKIDTGAWSSAIDVASYGLREVEGQGLVAELRLALGRPSAEHLTVVEVPVARLVVVCNTGGMREQRPVIETEIRLGPVRKRIRLTVTNRAGMRYRMILGRQALAGDFLVDVGRKYLLRRKG